MGESRAVAAGEEGLNWAAVGFGLDPGVLDLRILRGALGCTELGVSVLRLAGGTRVTTGHRHPTGEEVYVLVSGRAEIKIDDEVVALEPLTAVRLRGEQTRALRALAGSDAV